MRYSNYQKIEWRLPRIIIGCYCQTKKIIKNVLEHTEKYQYKFINETKYYISFTGSC